VHSTKFGPGEVRGPVVPARRGNNDDHDDDDNSGHGH
jgi:hypothetical protein